MQVSFSTFSTLLSEFQSYLKTRIPPAVLFPLAAVSASLTVIAGYVWGWATVEARWQQYSALGRVLVLGGAALSFFVAAYVLSGFQSVVARWFQGDWPLGLASWTGQLTRHREVWAERRTASQQIHTLHRTIQTARQQLLDWGVPPARPVHVIAPSRFLPRYHRLSADDIREVAAATAPDGALHTSEDVIGMLSREPLAPDVPLTRQQLIPAWPTSWSDRMVLIALTLPLELVPHVITPGDAVSIYALRADRAEQIDRGGWLVVDLREQPISNANGVLRTLVKLTLAVPPEIAPHLLSVPANTLRLTRLTSAAGAPAPVAAAPAAAAAHVHPSVDPLPPNMPQQLDQLEQQVRRAEQWIAQLRVQPIERIDDGGYGAAAAQVVQMLDALQPLAQGAPTAEQVALWERLIQTRQDLIRLLEKALREVEYRLDQGRKRFRLYYPLQSAAVAPTAIGNVMRAVDSYAETVYGLDAALVLPRLQAVLEQATLDQLKAAEERLLFLEWTCLGALAVGGTGTLIAAQAGAWGTAALLWLAGLPLAYLIYLAALSAALGYAETLRLVFDRERGKVFATLGLTPATLVNQQQERELWERVGQWWEYGQYSGVYSLDRTTTK